MTVATSDGDERLGLPLLERGAVALALLLDRRRAPSVQQHPDNPVLHELSDESRLVVSEPLGDLAGAWNEVPESSWGVVREGQDELRPSRRDRRHAGSGIAGSQKVAPRAPTPATRLGSAG